jgi:hypothetical protein
MPEPTLKTRTFPDSKLAPPILLQRRSQLSLRALFFLQMQAATIMLFVSLAMVRQKTTLPVIVMTFISVTLFTCLVAALLGQSFSVRWWWAVGPATGVLVGLIASSLTLSPNDSFGRLMYTALAASTFLIAICVWQGRYLQQEETDF